MNELPNPKNIPIAVRAYAKSAEEKTISTGKRKQTKIGFSDWTLIFDTETLTDATQSLRFGCYQLRKMGELTENGLFYDPSNLSKAETKVISQYAEKNGFELMTVNEFAEWVFFEYVFKLSALCIGFNLPFDLSRLAIRHAPARNLRDGFTFVLIEKKWLPRVRVKHLNSRASLIELTYPPRQQTPRSRRNRHLEIPRHRGHFVDVKTLACALLSNSWTLKSLCDHLKTKHRKLGTDEHGKSLTIEYLHYAVQDVQVTWECFEHLERQYESYGLSETPINQIYSEASLGKAYLQQMGIKPWRKAQPDFPPELIGAMMSSYYGGRSEIHIRREAVRILYCDFLSMYPTVCALMGLWRFVIAKKTNWKDVTSETAKLLDKSSLADLQRKVFWQNITTLVQVQPSKDVFPIRAKYDDHHYSIGVNHLTSRSPMWYTLADCVASKLITGHSPQVIKAIRFQPGKSQPSLQPIKIIGNSDFQVNPKEDDFYRRLIDLRNETKDKLKASTQDKREQLDAEQLALKICANATSYGIFVELNEGAQNKPQQVFCYGQSEEPFCTVVNKTEDEGKYFHPLLATLITGAARLMLAMAECLARENGINWAFCDTDSMALAKPEGMTEAEFIERAKKAQEWFTPLNPYQKKGSLFKIEDVNYRLVRGKESEEITPLYCFAVSAKRYALFNLGSKKEPIIRKASGHGLGHLLAPYDEKESPSTIPKPRVALSKIGVERWQYDLWYLITKGAIDGDSAVIDFSKLPGLKQPAVSRYSATTPTLLRWFNSYNADKPFKDQVKPFNFLLSFNSKTEAKNLRPISSYDKDIKRAVKRCFDRKTTLPIAADILKSCRELLAQYHLHSEAKFENGDFLDSGFTSRRHIIVDGIEHIGKEANHLEEQFHLGRDANAQVVYGMPELDFQKLTARIIQDAKKFSRLEIAKALKCSVRELSRLLGGQVKPTRETVFRIQTAIDSIKTEDQEKREILAKAKNISDQIGLRNFAKLAGVDAANLYHCLKGNRNLSIAALGKIQTAIAKIG